jgi:hypothetical protein
MKSSSGLTFVPQNGVKMLAARSLGGADRQPDFATPEQP